MAKRFEATKKKYSDLSLMQDGSALAPNFETKRSEFREFYSKNLSKFQSSEKAFRNLIQLILDAEEIRPKVSSRVKDRDECLKKFQLKYQQKVEREGRDYNIQDHITDMVGIRIVCLYEDQIAQIRDILIRNFEKLNETDKTFLLNEDIRVFGYKGLHLDLRLSSPRVEFNEYARFKDVQFEVQIRSIVQDAWSEVDHKLKYKKKIPEGIQRRIVRMAALFELADQEFVAIKNETVALEEHAKAEQESGRAVDTIVDAVSFAALVKSLHPKYNFDAIAIDGFVDELTEMKNDITIGYINSAIEKHRDTIWEYKQYKRKEKININPFTEIRHVVYLSNATIFKDILYPNQETAFCQWLSEDR
jgi:ppGpp synthetase/RelA/SpoT-type nucleotidyltranferase